MKLYTPRSGDLFNTFGGKRSTFCKGIGDGGLREERQKSLNAKAVSISASKGNHEMQNAY